MAALALGISFFVSSSFGENAMQNTVRIGGFIGTVDIIAGETLSISQSASDPAHHIDIVKTNTEIVVAGTESAPSVCVSQNDNTLFQWSDGKSAPLSDFPALTITVPSSTDLVIELVAGRLTIQEAGSLSITTHGCSALSVDRVHRLASFDLSAGTTLTGRDFTDLSLTANSARSTLADVKGAAQFNLERAARVDVAAHSGALNAIVGRSARLSIASGSAAPASVDVQTAGRFTHGGTMETTTLALDRAARAEVVSLGADPSITQDRTSRLIITGNEH